MLFTFRFFFSLLLGLVSFLIPYSTKAINLHPSGSKHLGYVMNIEERGMVLTNNESELNLTLYNTDASIVKKIPNWKARVCEKWGKDGYVLSDTMSIPEFDAFLSIKVYYQKVNEQVVKRQVVLYQTAVPKLYYILDEATYPNGEVQNFLSFEHSNHPVGFIHELFPAMAWVRPDSLLLGIVSDNGFNNHYTRTTRRRNNGMGGGFLGMRKLPDVNLFSVGDGFLNRRFGEYYDLDHCLSDTIPLELNTCSEGLKLITPMKNNAIYSLDFDCKRGADSSNLSLKLYRINKDGLRVEELEHGIKYMDNYPIKEDTWSHFRGSVLVPYLAGDRVELVMNKVQVKNVRLLDHHCKGEAYNYLPQGEEECKTSYYFVDRWHSQKQFQIQSQKYLAEGKGFEGSLIEKALYGNMQGAIWIRAIDDFSPFVVPNMNYSPDMYARDSYWTIISSYNKALNVGIWEAWAKTQTAAGAIGTIITPYMGSVEAKDNEATIEWLMWALLNKRRFGISLPKDQIDKAVHYVLKEFDSNKDGICESHFTLSQVDICKYEPKTSNLAVNQGMFAVALRTIRALGYDISDEYLLQAELAYQSFYDAQRKHLLFDKRYPEIISLTDFIPEFLSLWLFEHPMLSNEMVCNQMDLLPLFNQHPEAPYPALGTTAPICIRVSPLLQNGYAYLTEDYQPFEDFGINYKNGARDGYYYNGGSWLRSEYCAYAVAYMHGWKNAEKMMANRAWAEMNLNPNMPYSKEFIPTKWNSTSDWWLSTRCLSWNSFLIIANEMIGKRNPNMDPDYKITL